MRALALALTLVLGLGDLLPAQEAARPAPPFFGTVVGAGKVYGGPADRFWAHRDLRPGEVLRVLEVRGDWLRIAPPGDLTAVVASRLGDRELVAAEPDGPEWLVKADDLQIRGRIPPAGDPNRDYPPLGSLQAGDRVLGLEILSGTYLRIAIPTHIEAWVLASTVKAGDTGELSNRFREGWLAARRELLAAAPLSGARIAAAKAEAVTASKADELFARVDAQRIRPAADRNLEGLSEELAAFAESLPESDPRRVRAAGLAKELSQWQAQQEEIAALKARLDAAAKEARDAEERYAKRLADERRRLEEGQTNPAPAVEMHTGWVRKRAKIRGISKPGPDYFLEFGGRSLALLESDRYDLSEFEGVLVKVVTTDGAPRRRPGDTEDTLKVRRFEILETPRR